MSIYDKLLDIIESDFQGKYKVKADSEIEFSDNGVDNISANKDESLLTEDFNELERIIKSNKIKKDLLEYQIITGYFYKKENVGDYVNSLVRLKNKLNTSNITQNAKIIINKLLSHSELAIIQKITISEPIIELEKKLSKELEETEKLKKD